MTDQAKWPRYNSGRSEKGERLRRGTLINYDFEMETSSFGLECMSFRAVVKTKDRQIRDDPVYQIAHLD